MRSSTTGAAVEVVGSGAKPSLALRPDDRPVSPDGVHRQGDQVAPSEARVPGDADREIPPDAPAKAAAVPARQGLAGSEELLDLRPLPGDDRPAGDADAPDAAGRRVAQSVVGGRPPQGEDLGLLRPDGLRGRRSGVVAEERGDALLVQFLEADGAAGPALEQVGGDLVLAEGLPADVSQEPVIAGVRPERGRAGSAEHGVRPGAPPLAACRWRDGTPEHPFRRRPLQTPRITGSAGRLRFRRASVYGTEG